VSGPGADERGSVTILFVAVIVLACLLVVSAGRLGAALTAQARAETAADAAALAAADSLALGVDDARAQAAMLAAAHGARLVSCDCEGLAAEVVVELDGAIAASLPRPARATARAEVDFSCAFGSCAPMTARPPLPATRR
jgi:secretion/DNA translocation related TadE-like protein